MYLHADWLTTNTDFWIVKKVLAEFYKNSCAASQKAMPLPALSLTTNKTVDICDENNR